jgi:MoaA/NifB/PqqE/SkfB family radical SAM enzyme
VKILFIQLPLLDHGGGYIAGNVEYASAQLCAYIKKKYPSTCPEVLPSVYSLLGSNKKIIDYIHGLKPDILSFTMYLWNAERQLEIARRVRSLLPEILIICGGPEISRGSFLLEGTYHFIDFFVHGEGEWFFDKLFSGDVEPGLVTQPSDELVTIENVVEPFTSHWLNVMTDGTIYFEFSRGCPFQCTYCYYSKNCSMVREQPRDLFFEVFKESYRFNEIYILSPTLNSNRDFKDMLKKISDMNTGTRLHSEVRPEFIDKETAALMYEAGFRSLEVGLQSMTPEVRKAVNRKSDPVKELKGMVNLQEAGIDLKIGIIPGLPGETADTFIDTVDTLMEHGFGENIELYPLMVLPGTKIRDEAEMKNISFQKKPPYFYMGGWGMSAQEISNIALNLEMETGLTFDSFSLPDFCINKDGMLCNSIFIKKPGNTDIEKIIPHCDSSVMNIFIENGKNIYSFLSKCASLHEEVELLRIIFIHGKYLNEDRLKSLVPGESTIYRRMNLFSHLDDVNPWQFFHLVETLEDYNRSFEIYDTVIPLLDLKEHMMPFLQGDEALLVREAVYERVREKLLMLFRGNQEDLTFESESDRKDFYNATDFEYVEYPFGFYGVYL